nr:peroxidase 5-like [Ipomoea batatas]
MTLKTLWTKSWKVWWTSPLRTLRPQPPIWTLVTLPSEPVIRARLPRQGLVKDSELLKSTKATYSKEVKAPKADLTKIGANLATAQEGSKKALETLKSAQENAVKAFKELEEFHEDAMAHAGMHARTIVDQWFEGEAGKQYLLDLGPATPDDTQGAEDVALNASVDTLGDILMDRAYLESTANVDSGCDASVLVDSTQNNKAEKDHPANNPSLRGFDVIDKAKHRVESQCPHTVSCADIVAFAARDSAAVLGGINYGVPAGRRDGRVSLFDDPTRHLPSFLADAEELEKNFGRKGLSLDEMVTLSGAHSVGRSHCSSFTNRLYSSNSSTQLLEDPSLEAELGNKLRQMCPRQTSVDPTAPLDFRTPNRYLDRLCMRTAPGATLVPVPSIDLRLPLVFICSVEEESIELNCKKWEFESRVPLASTVEAH